MPLLFRKRPRRAREIPRIELQHTEARKRFFINGVATPLTELHTPYLRIARTLLEEVKNNMGMLQQDGLRHRLSNGVTITVMSQFGRDEMWIDVPLRAGGLGGEEPFGDYAPYLWVGANLKEGGFDKYGDQVTEIHLCIWEPGNDGDILSNRHRFVDDEAGPDVYPLQNNMLMDIDGTLNSKIAYTKQNFYQKKNGIDPIDATEWDEVAILDASDDQFPGRMKPGEYFVGVMLVGPDCYTVTPTTVTLKIRLGKGEHAFVEERDIVIGECTSYQRGIVPFGWFDQEEEDICSRVPDFGPNPRAKHWWRGGVSVALPPRQDRVSKKDLDVGSIQFNNNAAPDRGFQDGEWPSQCDRCRGCNYSHHSNRLWTFITYGLHCEYPPFSSQRVWTTWHAVQGQLHPGQAGGAPAGSTVTARMAGGGLVDVPIVAYEDLQPALSSHAVPSTYLWCGDTFDLFGDPVPELIIGAEAEVGPGGTEVATSGEHPMIDVPGGKTQDYYAMAADNPAYFTDAAGNPDNQPLFEFTAWFDNDGNYRSAPGYLTQEEWLAANGGPSCFVDDII